MTLRPLLANPVACLLSWCLTLAASQAAHAVQLASESAPQVLQQIYDICMNSPTDLNIIHPVQRAGFCTCAADKAAAALMRADLPSADIASDANRAAASNAAEHALLVCAQPFRLDRYKLSKGYNCWARPEPETAIWSLPRDRRTVPCNCLEQYLAAHADPALFLDHVPAGKLEQHLKTLTEEGLASCTSENPPPLPAPEPLQSDSAYTPPGIVNFAACKPQYPRASLLAEEQGNTILKIDIDEYGNYQRSTLLQSAGYFALDYSAMRDFSACAYRPAMREGKPVAGSMHVVYVWKIND